MMPRSPKTLPVRAFSEGTREHLRSLKKPLREADSSACDALQSRLHRGQRVDRESPSILPMRVDNRGPKLEGLASRARYRHDHLRRCRGDLCCFDHALDLDLELRARRDEGRQSLPNLD